MQLNEIIWSCLVDLYATRIIVQLSVLEEGLPREIRGPGAKEEKEAPLRAKGAEYFHAPEVSFGK